MLQEQLSEADPSTDWQCSAEVVFLTPSMPERALAAARAADADVVVLRLVGSYFFDEFAIERIRQISPWLYRRCRSLAQWLQDVGGGGPDAAAGLRGWVCRFPRWVLLNTLGTAPRISVVDAISTVKRTVDELLKLEDVHVIVRLPSYPKSRHTNLEAYEARITAFGSAVRAHCDERRVPYYDWAEVRRLARDSREIGPDRFHPVVDTRELDARSMGEAVLMALRDPIVDVHLGPATAGVQTAR
jgi:hypothetical protein